MDYMLFLIAVIVIVLAVILLIKKFVVGLPGTSHTPSRTPSENEEPLDEEGERPPPRSADPVTKREYADRIYDDYKMNR